MPRNLPGLLQQCFCLTCKYFKAKGQFKKLSLSLGTSYPNGFHSNTYGRALPNNWLNAKKKMFYRKK